MVAGNFTGCESWDIFACVATSSPTNLQTQTGRGVDSELKVATNGPFREGKTNHDVWTASRELEGFWVEAKYHVNQRASCLISFVVMNNGNLTRICITESPGVSDELRRSVPSVAITNKRFYKFSSLRQRHGKKITVITGT